MEPVKKIFIIGGTGAQGIPVVKALTKDGKYHLRILTRNASHQRALELAKLPNVELIEGTVTNEDDLRAGFSGCDGAWINIDGFTLGEMAELYWGIRCYELAFVAGVRFYVMASLAYGLKMGGFDPKFHCGHLDGKGRVAEFLLSQPRDKMGVSIFTTTAYMDMVHHGGTAMTPRLIDGVVTWSVPLGDGAVPHIALEDVGFYVRWIFDNPARSNGLNLEVSTEHVHYADMAAAFERVTGKPARYVDVGVEEYFAAHPRFGDGLVGEGAREGAALTWRQNFEAFWNLFRHSGGNTGVLKRDYALLDEIHPGRIKSVEEYFRRHQEGLWESVQPENIKTVLKATEDIEALK